MDWSKTPLGPIDSWPQSLRTTVSLCLSSNFPISLAWGKHHTQIYNDGYWPICGEKHPESMGQDFTECWASPWPVIGDAFSRALAGETSFLENQRMFLDRNGYLEETFFTFSFSPIRDESGGIGGLFHPVTETTSKMLSERRTRVLRDLAERAAEAHSVDEVFQISSNILAECEFDLPLAMIYVIDNERKRATLSGVSGIDRGTSASPVEMDLEQSDAIAWPLQRILDTANPLTLDNENGFEGLPCGPYPEDCQRVVLLPICPPGAEHPVAVLVAGVSPRLPFNEMYSSFLGLLSSAITAAVANARAYEEERRRAELLAEIDRAKTTFFSNVSHEFRTPLMLMLAPLEDSLTATDVELPEPHRERLTVAHRNSLRLLKLVNTLLDFSRIEAGRVQASYEPTDLPTYTSELASNFRSLCEKAGLKYTVECRSLAESVFVDRDMWEKIVLNLISNAFKYTLEGEISVAMSVENGDVRLSVRDTGEGVPEGEMPKLFERFHRVETSHGRTQEGTGIGLALVHELVKLHGGDVRVESQLNEGTTFTVLIPLGKAHLPADRISAERTLESTSLGASPFVEEAARWIPGGDESIAPGSDVTHAARSDNAAALSPSTSPNPEHRPRVLLADDNADMREYICRLLSEHYDVTTVADGSTALKEALANPPDLILADIMMPNLDGFGLLEQLRSQETTKLLPIILVSARAGEEARVEGLEAGADDYLTKPFSAKELMASVRAHVQLGRLRRQSDAKIHESEARFRTMADCAPVIIWVSELDGQCTYLNRQWYGFTGMPDGEGLGSRWQSAIHPDDRQGLVKGFEEATRHRRFYRSEFRLRYHDGGYRWCIVSASPRTGTDQRFVGMTGSIVEIDELKRIESQLRAANMAKSEFLANMSHEIRTPMSAILGYTDILGKQLDDPDDMSCVEIIRSNGRFLLDIINDILDISKIEAGKMEIAATTFRLDRLVANVHSLMNVRAAEKSLDFQVEFSERVPQKTKGDSKRLKQILLNLIGNAIKFTEQGSVRLAIRCSDDPAQATIQFDVIDTGIGMTAEQQQTLFQPFSQGDSSVGRKFGGTGLGLAISQRLAKMMGGRIFAESVRGQGSTFSLQIPTETIADAAYVAPDHWAASAPSPEPRIQSSSGDDPIRGHILVVDDRRDIRFIAQRFIERAGGTVVVGENGEDAVAKVAAAESGGHPFDLIVIDMQMPVMDGYEATRRLRAEGFRKPIIALTAHAMEGDRQTCVEAGCTEYVAKPLDGTTFVRLIARLLSSA
ncbi:ATP-binding protein [Allorhodopirellula solitaria]|nr:ATP-binding protein [Allorhodopirellula solitaria]